MTRTTKIEYHPNRTIVHFGSPVGTVYWRRKPKPKPDKKKPKKETR